jgi:hypothetical protein
MPLPYQFFDGYIDNVGQIVTSPGSLSTGVGHYLLPLLAPYGNADKLADPCYVLSTRRALKISDNVIGTTE